jgi:hypothetical protein
MLIKVLKEEFEKASSMGSSKKTNSDDSLEALNYINFELTIQDTGVGMSEEGCKKLFIDFGKLDENSSRNRQGTGLGLSICKKIIEQMGGSVHVTSKIGEGSKFIINIKTRCIRQRYTLTQDKFEENQGIGTFVFLHKDKLHQEQKSFIEGIIEKLDAFDH